MAKIEEFYNDRSYLSDKPTNLKDITCRGAKFDSIRNTTGARLPSDKELREETPKSKSIISRIVGFLGS